MAKIPLSESILSPTQNPQKAKLVAAAART
jgi:hypothetical protein